MTGLTTGENKNPNVQKQTLSAPVETQDARPTICVRLKPWMVASGQEEPIEGGVAKIANVVLGSSSGNAAKVAHGLIPAT